MPDEQRVLRVSAMTAGDADAIVKWRYEPAYARYDLTSDHVETLTNPAHRYFAVWLGGELIGHVCLGSEARVPGLPAVEGVDDLGVGIRPDLVGRGNARHLLPALLAELAPYTEGRSLRVAVAGGNKRAQAAAEVAGFRRHGEHENQAGQYVLMSRPGGS